MPKKPLEPRYCQYGVTQVTIGMESDYIFKSENPDEAIEFAKEAALPDRDGISWQFSVVEILDEDEQVEGDTVATFGENVGRCDYGVPEGMSIDSDR